MTKAISPAKRLEELVADAQSIIIIQPDNPDADSLGSAVALEQILTQLNKNIVLVCATKLSSYLNYIVGFDRVVNDIPNLFDLSIIVDSNSSTLLQNLSRLKNYSTIFKRPVVVLDHHLGEADIAHQLLITDVEVVSTSELIYKLALELNWPINQLAYQAIAIGLLADSLGLTTPNVNAQTIYHLGQLVEAGVSIADIETKRRLSYLKSPRLVNYKGQLLQRIEYYLENRLNLLVIPFREIESYSYEYNPSALVLEDMRLVKDNLVSIIIKSYPDRLTAKIRTSNDQPIADKIAEHFNGGGHAHAAGCKLALSQTSLEQFKTDLIKTTQELLIS